MHKFCRIFSLDIYTGEVINASTSLENRSLQAISDILTSSEISISMPSRYTMGLTPLKDTYEAVAETFTVKPTKVGYSNFVNALNQVTEGKKAACDDRSNSCADITILAIQYQMLRNEKGTPLNMLRIREVFGAILWIKELESPFDSERKKRHSHKCQCPNCPKSSFTEFFNCLDPHDMQPIMGMRQTFYKGGSPCLALALDTTGSMVEEIEDAKNVIINFLASEKSEPLYYVLVPFTDLSNEKFLSESKLSQFFLCTILQFFYFHIAIIQVLDQELWPV